MHRLKFLITTLFWLGFAPFIPLQALRNSFWNAIQLNTSLAIKKDFYKINTTGMHPSDKKNQMNINRQLEDAMTMQSYVIRWYHAPSIIFERDRVTENDHAQLNHDPEAVFSFTGTGITLSAQLLASIDFLRLRMGLGGGIRYSFFKELIGKWIKGNVLNKPNSPNSNQFRYKPPHDYYFTWTPLVRIGFKLIEKKNYTLLVDGTWLPAIYTFSQLNRNSYWIYSRNIDLGTTCEKQISEYFYWSLRIAYGLCSHNEIVESLHVSTLNEMLLSVSHYITGITLQIGMGITLPIGNQCPVPGCRSSVNHKHGGKHYKGNRRLNN